MTLTYNFSLVFASFMVAVLASYTALHLASRVWVARGRMSSLAWMAGGALSMGTGIWSMHFVGMLGASIEIPMVYGPWWTLVSLAMAVAASGLALEFVRRENLTSGSLVVGSAVMAGAIVSMHYAGMMALQINPTIHFEPYLVTLSVGIAMAASFLALKLFVALRSPAVTHLFLKRATSALVMGMAIFGMHYTGMAAANFSPDSICTSPESEVSNAWLAGTIAVFTLLMLAMALIVSLYDAHLMSNTARNNARLVLANQKLHHESLQLAQANLQIREQSTSLQAMNSELDGRVLQRTEQLQATVQELEAFSHAVAHDLRGQLSSIGGFCGLLGQPAAGSLNDRGLHYLRRIKCSSKQMAELIDALLSLTHLSRVDLKHQQVDLSRLAQDILNDCNMRDPMRTVRSVVQAGMLCMGDAGLLNQVLVNLIGNAWKFSAPQANAVIEVGVKMGPDAKPVFFVSDNGAGFDMAYIDKLFGTFQRLHSPDEFEGAGIGLAMVHRIIERHEGRIWAESAPGQGARFFFTVWAAAGTTQARQEALADAATL